MHLRPTASILLCGTAMLLATNAAALTPGLAEHRVPVQYQYNEANFPGDLSPWYGRTVLGPVAVNIHNGNNNGNGVDDWPPECYDGWARATTFYYKGYIHIGEGTNNVSMVANFQPYFRLSIGGVSMLSGWDPTFSAANAWNPAPGWHKFELLLGLHDGPYGPPNGPNQWHPNRHGLTFDWQGRANYPGECVYAFPELRQLQGPGWVTIGDLSQPYDPVTNPHWDNPAWHVFPQNVGSDILFSATLPGVVEFYTQTVSVNANSATFAVPLVLDPEDEGMLWVCCGTSPQGATTNGWDFVVPWSASKTIAHTNAAPVLYEIPVTGLTLGQEYHYRFVSITTNDAFHFAPAPPTFTTRVNIETLAATHIADTTVTLPVRVNVVPDVPGTLCVYYGLAGTENNPLAGTRTIWMDAITADVINITVIGLTMEKTYWFRHAYDLGGGSVVFADGTLWFTTEDPNKPARFAFRPAQPNDGPDPVVDWDEPGAWLNLDLGTRAAPGLPGDAIQLDTDANLLDRNRRRNPTFILGRDAGIGVLDADFKDREWNSWNRMAILRDPAASPVTLSLDAGVAAARATILYGDINLVQIGANDDLGEDFKLLLAQPLLTRKTKNQHEQPMANLLINAVITGGTALDPRPLVFSNEMNIEQGAPWLAARLRVMPRNPHNDFVGDIVLHTAGDRCALHVGGATQDRFNYAWVSWPSDDAVLGDPANRVIMTHPNCRLNIETGDTFVLNRILMGTGRVRTAVMDEYGSEDSHHGRIRQLQLGPDCIIAPGFDESVAGLLPDGVNDSPAVGTLALHGSTLLMDSAARFIIKVTPGDNVSDKIILDIDPVNFGLYHEGVYAPCPVDLGGILEIVPLNGVHIPSGTTWTILETVAPVPFTNPFKRPTGYRLEYHTDSNGNLLSITATKLATGSLLLVK